MDKISDIVEKLVTDDDYIMHLGPANLINWSSYARKIAPEIENMLKKKVKMGSIVTALTRYFKNIPSTELSKSTDQIIERLSVHSNLEGITFERSEKSSEKIQALYQKLLLSTNSFITLTQGNNEITIVAESQYASKFRKELTSLPKIYDKKSLVGISIKFHLKYLEIPNILFQLHKSIVIKKINIIEIISTATELTFIINKKDLHLALESLQKSL